MNFAYISDAHLKTFTWSKRSQINKDSFYSFKQACDYCLREAIGLFLGGDTFDSSTLDSPMVNTFRACIEPLIEAGIPVWAIQGQHDKSDPPWPTSIVPGIRHVDKEVITLGKVKCWAMDMRVKEEAKKALEEVPEDVEVLFVHQLIKQAFDFEGKWDFDLNWVPKGVHTVIAGDYHEPMDKVFKMEDGREVRLTYNGSTHMCKIDEIPRKHFQLWSFPNFEMEPVRLKTRPYLFYEAKDEDSFSNLLDDIGNGLISDAREAAGIRDTQFKQVSVPVLHVTYSASIEQADSRIRAAIGDFAYFWPKPEFAPVESDMPDLALPEDSDEGNIPLAECLKVVCDENDPAFDFTLAVLEREPETVFREARKKFGVEELLNAGGKNASDA